MVTLIFECLPLLPSRRRGSRSSPPSLETSPSRRTWIWRRSYRIAISSPVPISRRYSTTPNWKPFTPYCPGAVTKTQTRSWPRPSRSCGPEIWKRTIGNSPSSPPTAITWETLGTDGFLWTPDRPVPARCLAAAWGKRARTLVVRRSWYHRRHFLLQLRRPVPSRRTIKTVLKVEGVRHLPCSTYRAIDMEGRNIFLISVNLFEVRWKRKVLMDICEVPENFKINGTYVEPIFFFKLRMNRKQNV